MIDTLDANRSAAENISLGDLIARKRLEQASPDQLADDFAALTLHRPSNVDARDTLSNLVRCFVDFVSPRLPLAWPTHPRTIKTLEEYDLLQE